jgi:beta-galactosidase
MILMAVLFSPSAARASMFPPPKSVASKIRIDGRGFVINGKRVFVVSGSLHYPRIPRSMWADRMEKMKRAGFNCISTYIFWNYEEPREGQFNFHGRHNIVAFVKLAQKMGFYVMLRIGPYDDAEWDSGGYPVWLRFIPGLSVRSGDAPFLDAIRQYYNKLLPMLVPLQVTHGGPIIMMQLDNEDQQGWGAVLPNHYYKFFYHECIKRGVDVPMFFSGQHHGPDPAGKRPFNHADAKTPWFTSEMWSGWFSQYGEWPVGSHRRMVMMRAPWDVIADGGAGYNIYMTIGGSNFSHWNDHSTQASYDFGAPVGQGGDLRPSYYNYKQANYFGRSFQSVLADSKDVTPEYEKFAPNAKIAARESSAGTIVFLRNFTRRPRTVIAQIGGKILLPANRTIPVILSYKLNSEFKISALCGRVLGYFRQKPGVITLIMYGDPGSTGLVRIQTANTKNAKASRGWISIRPGEFSKNIKFTSGSPHVYQITGDGHQFRLVVMSNALAHDTWIIKKHRLRYIVWGPQFIGHAHLLKGELTMNIERPMLNHVAGIPLGLLSPGRPPTEKNVEFPRFSIPVAPPLGRWYWRADDQPAATQFNDSSWLASSNPRQIGADSYPGPYEWYRSHMTVPKTGNYVLNLSGVRSEAEIFIDGRMRSIGGSGFHFLHLTKGRKTLAVFTINRGRSKLWPYIGPLHDIDQMGLFGPVYLKCEQIQSRLISAWRVKRVVLSIADVVADVLSNERGSKGWRTFKNGDLLPSVERGYWWLRASTGGITADSLRFALPALPSGVMFFVDGHQLTMNRNPDGTFHTVMRIGWHRGDRKNRIDMIIPVKKAAAVFTGRVRMFAKDNVPAFGRTGRITPWKMHGGIGPINPKTGWKSGAVATGVPTFYKNSFVISTPAAGLHLVLRVAMTGMGGGYVWINGHNLGRYPDRIMPAGLYIPSAWLHSGRNSMIIFDERGHAPAQVHLALYANACRQRMKVVISVP